MPLARRAAGGILALALAFPTAAQAAAEDGATPVRELAHPKPPTDLSHPRAKFRYDREADQRLQDLGWRLAAGNAPFCENAPLAIGLRIQDAESFGAPDVVRQLTGRRHDFTVRAAAKGSPAAEAGLYPYQAVLAIDGQALSAWPKDHSQAWQRYERAHDLILASLDEDGAVEIALERGKTRKIAGQPACATRFEMQTRGDVAMADGTRVRFGKEFPALAYPDDEFAAIIAHELAHNILGHPIWLSEKERSRREVRMTEREADRLMPWLLVNAGFAPEAALRFMERWGPGTSRGVLRARTHESWKDRVRTIAEEIPRVRAAQQPDGRADWRTHFRRELLTAVD